MTPHDLIAAFDVLADAPDGVKRLRELVLSLAVRGKLVPQDPRDEAAGRLVGAARAWLEERAAGVRRGSWKPLPTVSAEEQPFDLPPGWAWARVNDTGNYVNGLAFKPSDWKESGLPIIRIQNLTDPTKPFNYATGDYPDDVLVRDGDLLVSWSATLEAFLWDRGLGVLNQHIFRVVPCDVLTTHRFLFWLLRQAIRDMAASDHAHGLVMAHINRGPFLNHVVGIPPLAEQRRIVARVDELMGLLDRLETARATRDAVRRDARDAALADLRDAPDAEAVEAAWGRIARQMDDLFAEPEDVAPLRQAVLQLAVRGRLVEQDQEEEPASTLLERVLATQASLVKKRLARKPKVSGAPFSDECPFDLPPQWVWCRLGQVLRTCSNGISASPNDNGAGFPLLRISAATGKPSWLVDVEDHRFGEVSRSRAESYFVEAGDLLACRFNGNLHYVGAVAQVPPFAGGPYMHPDKLIRLQSIEVDHRYLVVAINAETTRAQVREVAATTAGNIGINGKQLQGLCIPLPPLNEQTRIAAKVDALMALCDDLEARLNATGELHGQFAGAAVHHLDV